MAANETIDKLKSAGYITVTADSQGIAEQCDISAGNPNDAYCGNICSSDTYVLPVQITDPMDSSKKIYIYFTGEPTSENSCDLALIKSDGTLYDFTGSVAIETDPDSGKGVIVPYFDESIATKYPDLYEKYILPAVSAISSYNINLFGTYIYVWGTL